MARDAEPAPAASTPTIGPQLRSAATDETPVGERVASRPIELADGLATPRARRHVLVADDEAHIGRIIQMKLEQGPFRVTLAYDGRQALEVLEREVDVDLVLLDLMMPELSGLDVLAAIRANARYHALPCIILTAAGQDQQYKQAMALGATEFMTKPFSPKKLYARAAELAGLSDDAPAGGR